MEAKTIQTSGDFIDRDAEKAFLGAFIGQTSIKLKEAGIKIF